MRRHGDMGNRNALYVREESQQLQFFYVRKGNQTQHKDDFGFKESFFAIENFRTHCLSHCSRFFNLQYSFGSLQKF